MKKTTFLQSQRETGDRTAALPDSRSSRDDAGCPLYDGLTAEEIEDLAEHGTRSFRQSARLAVVGLVCGYQGRNLKIQTAAGGGVLVLAGLLRVEAMKWALLILTISMVLSLELINTALEKNVDLASGQHYHPLAKLAKDIAAGAVLLASAASVLIGLVLLGPPLWALIFN